MEEGKRNKAALVEGRKQKERLKQVRLKAEGNRRRLRISHWVTESLGL
jgi:hypothetical protein